MVFASRLLLDRFFCCRKLRRMFLQCLDLLSGAAVPLEARRRVEDRPGRPNATHEGE